MTLFCLLVLFANVSALIAFARTIFGDAKPAACLALLAGLGWPANIVFAGNFDQLLLLPLLPLIAALALRAGSGVSLWSASILIGILGAAALFAYIELAFLGLVVALAFVIPPDAGLRPAIGRAILVCCIVVPIIVILTWPGFEALLRMLTSQYAMVDGAVRPGEGYFSRPRIAVASPRCHIGARRRVSPHALERIAVDHRRYPLCCDLGGRMARAPTLVGHNRLCGDCRSFHPFCVSRAL